MRAASADGTVSVVIPSYNRADLVTESIDGVLAQTDRDFDVIVADDGSTDGTAEVLRPYLDRVRYLRQPNGGLAAALRGVARRGRPRRASQAATSMEESNRLENGGPRGG